MYQSPAVAAYFNNIPRNTENCRNAVPFSRSDCICNTTPMNRFAFKLNEEQDKITKSKILAAEVKGIEQDKCLKSQFIMNPLPGYSNTKPSWVITPVENDCVVNERQAQGLELPPMCQFTRISPEFHDLLQNYENRHRLERNVTINSEYEGMSNLPVPNEPSPRIPDWASYHPKLYEYLQDVMTKDSPLNKLYGIDFKNNFNAAELEIFKSFPPLIAVDMMRTVDLLKLLQSNATLTDDQILFLAHFLRDIAHLGSKAFDFFMVLLRAALLDTNQVFLYIQNIYIEFQHQLQPDELRMVNDKLNLAIKYNLCLETSDPVTENPRDPQFDMNTDEGILNLFVPQFMNLCKHKKPKGYCRKAPKQSSSQYTNERRTVNETCEMDFNYDPNLTRNDRYSIQNDKHTDNQDSFKIEPRFKVCMQENFTNYCRKNKPPSC